MSQGTYEHIRQWVERIIQESTFVPPQDIFFYLHVTQCDTCRGALTLLAATRPEVFPELKHASCEECQTNLAEFIDYEEEQAGRGIRAYPEIWWHLLGCVECAEEYTRTRVLVQAHQQKALPFPFVESERLPMFKEPLARIPLRRDFLRVALPSRETMSVSRGRKEDKHVIFSEPIPPGHTIELSFRQATSSHWQATVTITPPIAGSVTVSWGDVEHREDISPQGVATISTLPEEVLLSPDGPDLELRIEPLAS